MENNLFHYKANVSKVVDGDTVYCDVDLGFNFGSKSMDFRFAGINCPEIKGPDRENGLKAKKFVEDRILNKQVIIVTSKDRKEKYGRYLAKVYYYDMGQWINLNDLLIHQGLALPYSN